MPKRCYVPWCFSGYDSAVKENKAKKKKNNAIFRAPKDPELRKKWCDAIGRTDKELSVRDSVCELHFAKTDVERFYETLMPDGTIHKIPKRCTLKRGAVPDINITVESDVTEIKEEHPTNMDEYDNAQLQGSKLDETEVADAVSVKEEIILEACPAREAESNAREYNVEDLRSDLKKFSLPEAWAYVFHNEEIHFHRWSSELTTTITVLIQNDMTARIRISEQRVTRTEMLDLTSFDNLVESLNFLGEHSLCQGTGINGSRAGSCPLSIRDWKSSFDRNHGKRCLPCSILRKKVIGAEKRRKTIEKERISKMQATLKATQRKNARLHERIQKLEAEVENSRKKKINLARHQGGSRQ